MPDSQGTTTRCIPDAIHGQAVQQPAEATTSRTEAETTLGTTYTPNRNNFNVDGNTQYMATLWDWYMPRLNLYDMKGNQSFNKDWLTSVKMIDQNPLTVEYNINPQAKWNDGSDMDWTAFKSTWQVNNGKNPAHTPPLTDGFRDIKSVEQGSGPKQAMVTYEKPHYPWESVFGTLYNPKAMDPETFAKEWIDNPHNE